MKTGDLINDEALNFPPGIRNRCALIDFTSITYFGARQTENTHIEPYILLAFKIFNFKQMAEVAPSKTKFF